MASKHISHTNLIVFHVAILIISIVLAIILAKSGAIDVLIGASLGSEILSSFIAGIFFTSILTVPSAAVAFYVLGQSTSSIWLVALVGGLGAALGDLLLFRLLDFGFGAELREFFSRASHGKLHKFLQIKFFSITLAILGALIIVSPLPDELGLTLMDLSGLKTKIITSFSFILNTIGILLLEFIARGALLS